MRANQGTLLRTELRVSGHGLRNQSKMHARRWSGWGVNMTADDIWATLESKSYNAVCSSCRSAVAPQHRDVYIAFKSGAERREWISRCVLEREEFMGAAENRNEILKVRKNVADGIRMMPSHLAGPNGLPVAHRRCQRICRQHDQR